MIKKVTEPSRIVTDVQVLKELARQGIDKNFVEFCEDYSPAHPAVKFYRDLGSNKRFTVISGYPRVTKGGKRIIPKWRKIRQRYISEDNIFKAGVTGKAVALVKDKKSAEWSPQVFLDGAEVECNPKAALLRNDPVNGRYHYNVLQWDYGICKRRLRIIEGGLIERFIFESDPGGDVSIKSNWEGDIKAAKNWGRDASGNSLKVETSGDKEIIPAEEFAEGQFFKIYPDALANDEGLAYKGHCIGCGLCGIWRDVMRTKTGPSIDNMKKAVDEVVEKRGDGVTRWQLPGLVPVECDYELYKDGVLVNPVISSKKYPIIVASSPETFYPAVDGYAVHGIENVAWDTLHDGAGNQSNSDETEITVSFWSGTQTDKWAGIWRGLLSLLTSAIPSYAVIIDATLTLYGVGKGNGFESLTPKINVFSALLASPTAIVDGDYDGVSATPFSTDIAYDDFDVNATTPLPNEFIFNQDGIAAINKAGYTELSLRESFYEAPDNEPDWEYWKLLIFYVATTEFGAPYIPKLVVTYTIGASHLVGGSLASSRLVGGSLAR